MKTLYPDQIEDVEGAPPAGGAGWQTTNSHPAKPEDEVSECGRVLASGFDRLVLSFNLTWRNTEFLKLLERLKNDAIFQDAEMPGILRPENGIDPWVFNIKPHGSEGYAYLLGNAEFFAKFTKALRPASRPNAMVDIHSETLWRLGPLQSVCRVIEVLESAGAVVESPKASRVDACLDILLPAQLWNVNLINCAVTRAASKGMYQVHSQLTGIEIGRKVLSARLYDKVCEIEQKSKKYWMYDMWRLESVPESCRAIRVEFQLRREAVTELGIDTVWQLFDHPVSLWSYLTRNWLKFVNDPTLHFDQRKSLPWWNTVQHGFMGVQAGESLIRAQAVSVDKKRLAQQVFGQLTSLVALDDETGDVTPGREVSLEEHIEKVKEGAALLEMNAKKLGEKVRRKLARYARRIDKMNEARELRKQHGFPTARIVNRR